jgi:Helix-hairpin-helix domain
MNNATIAQKLFEYAATLEANGHSLYRIRAYRRVAGLVKMLSCSIAELVNEGGRDALKGLPGIGAHLAFTLEKLVKEGDLRTLGPTPEQTDPRERLLSLPSVGDRLAERMQEDLGITTVDEAEQAAEEGLLAELGLEPRRLRGLKAALGARRSEKWNPRPVPLEPSVAELLAVDEEFRTLLETQSARREQVLGAPVLRTKRGAWSFRATLSQSPLAHRLKQARDWVVIHFENGQDSGERIIVTETRQHLDGQRVVRGRERECQACWAS